MAWNPASTREAVEALYIGYFGRAGEPGGVQYWINQINAAPNRQTGFALAAAAFSVQQEAKNEYAFLANPTQASPADFIRSLYTNLLERTPDASGLAYWIGQANAAAGNPFAIGVLVAQFISGAQNANGHNDIDTIQNKVDAAEFFTQALIDRNIPGTDANGQVRPDIQAAGKSIIGNVTGNAATVTAANQASADFAAGLGAVPGANIVVAAGDMVTTDALTLSLRSTEGDDTVTGYVGKYSVIRTSAGNDTVAVTVLSDGAEFDLHDGNDSLTLNFGASHQVAIDGGAGYDSVVINSTDTDPGYLAYGADLSIVNVQRLEFNGSSSHNASNWYDVVTIAVSSGQTEIVGLANTSDFILSGNGELAVRWPPSELPADITIEFDSATGGAGIFDPDVATVALEVSSNSPGADLYTYAEHTTVTGTGQWSGTVGLYSIGPGVVTFDASGLNAPTALWFGFNSGDYAITLTGRADTSTFSLRNNQTVDIVTGGGKDVTTITEMSNIVLNGATLAGYARIDWQAGDVIDVSDIGSYVAFNGAMTGNTVQSVLTNSVLGVTGMGNFTTFQFQNSTWVFYDGDGNTTLDAADGLLQISAVGLGSSALVVV